MPPTRYKEKLTHREIIKLVKSGRYRVDLSTGNIFSSKRSNQKSEPQTDSKLYYFKGGRGDSGYYFVRLYDNNTKHISIPVAHVVWIVGTQSPIPEGFQIHHHDKDTTNNAFENLFCLHKVDHKKWHALCDDPEVPF